MYTVLRRLVATAIDRRAVVSAGMMGLGLLFLVSCEMGDMGKTLKTGETFRDCASCPLMVVLPEGSFMMGSPESELYRWDDEGPRHDVTIQSFAVGVYEVTYSEWDTCVSEGACRHRADDYDGFVGPSHPVTDVSWHDAKEYVTWLKEKTGEEYRLLSEAEWEYVARAGTDTARYWGESSDGQCRYANGADDEAKTVFPDWRTATCSDGHVFEAPVGTYSANAYGVHDVLGNVYEWTEDCWNEDYVGAPRDGSSWRTGDCGVAMIRGGSWFSAPGNVRSAFRWWGELRLRDIDLGFRVARSAQIAVDDGGERPNTDRPDDDDDKEDRPEDPPRGS